MRKAKARTAALLVAAVLAGGLLAACDDGPAEEAGEAIDRSVENAGDAIERETD